MLHVPAMKNQLPRACAILTSCAWVFSGCGDAAPDSGKSSTSGGNPVTAPVDYLGAVSKGKQSSVSKLSLVNVQQAIQSYQAQEGKLPKNLNDLVTAGLLPTLPVPPRNMKFHYDATTGDVKVVPQ